MSTVELELGDPTPDGTTVAIIRNCVTCDSRFWISYGQLEWFQAKDFKPPRRCPACRTASRDRAPSKPFTQGDVERDREGGQR